MYVFAIYTSLRLLFNFIRIGFFKVHYNFRVIIKNNMLTVVAVNVW